MLAALGSQAVRGGVTLELLKSVKEGVSPGSRSLPRTLADIKVDLLEVVFSSRQDEDGVTHASAGMLYFLRKSPINSSTLR